MMEGFVEEFGEWLIEKLSPVIEEIIDRKMKEYLAEKKPHYMTISEVCQRLGICEATFHNMARKGMIDKIHKDGKVLVDARQIEKDIESGYLKRYGHGR